MFAVNKFSNINVRVYYNMVDLHNLARMQLLKPVLLYVWYI